MRIIPYGRQSINEEDIQAVVEVLRSDWITQGPKVVQFEEAIAHYCGAKHAVVTCNATAALHLACRSLGIKAGDRVWTSPNTFVASANCALYCGATIDFVDIDPHTYNMSVEALTQKLAAAKKTNTLPRLVIPVHFSGQSCEMQAIKALADRYGFYIVEDASHAIGGKYQNQFIGCCRYSDMTVFSFHPVKIITTGEGGAITTNNPTLMEKLKLLVTHGITRNPKLIQSTPPGEWYYEMQDLGHNYRITDIQCALGLNQLKRVDEFLLRRHELAARYNKALSDSPVVVPYQEKYNYSAYHLYVIRLKLKELKKSRERIFFELRRKNIGVNVHYIPVHMQPYYQRLGFKQGDFLLAEQYYKEAITLPLYPDLSRQDQDYVIACLQELLK
jgi:UDP-4-amino-4,6-dideoxy-N-acetyl-beta-L-altrosamine transaminase